MSSLSKVNSLAAQYMQNVLNGGRTLSQEIHDNLGLMKGFIGVTCKRDLSNQTDFDTGGICNAQESLLLLSEFIEQKLSEESLSCFFVNDSASKGDEVLSKYSNVLYHGTEVYHHISAGASTDEINRTIKAAETSANLVGVITSLKVAQQVVLKSELDDNAIRSIVAKLEYLIVGALDGETYLVWSSKPLEGTL